jgi:hypothetical protein
MKKSIWTFGLISGAILSVMMVATLPFIDRIGFDKSEVIGYTTMVAAFLLVFFGIRSYRDGRGGGSITLGRGLLVGTLITAVASACYTVTWEVLYFKFMPDFGAKYEAYMIEQARARGGPSRDTAVAQVRERARKFRESYNNPAFNAAVTFLEPLPVGLVISLVSAAVLRKTRREGEPVLATA